MKLFFLLFFYAFISISSFSQSPYHALAIGSSIPVPAVKLKSVNGKEYAIKDLMKSNGLLVMFSCNTCPYVVKYQGRTREIIKKAQEKDIGVILINANEGNRDSEDSYFAMQQYAKAQHYKDVPYVVDVNSAVANAFGATRTPETFLFNAKGQLIYHGAIDDNQDASQAKRKHLAIAIGEAVTGKDISINNTRSVGCAIKRKA